RQHGQHAALQVMKTTGRRINDLGIRNEDASIDRCGPPPDHPPEDLPEVGMAQFLRNMTRGGSHHEGPEVRPVTRFVDADDPWHMAKLSREPLIDPGWPWYPSQAWC